MPRYEVVVTLEPPKIFGLPEEHWTIVEAAPSHHYSPTLDFRTHNIVGHGTLSRYREYDDRLTATFVVNNIECQIDDNFLHAILEANNVSEALMLISQEIGRLCPLVSTFLGGSHLSFGILQAVQDGAPVPLSPRVTLMRVHAYNLSSLKEAILNASDMLDGLPTDERLDQALRYFVNGGTLYRLMTEQGVGQVLEAPCFLEFWKAMAKIVGDPSGEKDHQSRYKKFGLDKEYYDRAIRPLHNIRNRFGVAHIASVDAPAVVSLKDVGQCQAVAGQVIQRYVKFLRKSGKNLGDH